jgi:carbonic anhydrase
MRDDAETCPYVVRLIATRFRMGNVVRTSHDQIEVFAHAIHHPNNRPIQAVNARPVLRWVSTRGRPDRKPRDR